MKIVDLSFCKAVPETEGEKDEDVLHLITVSAFLKDALPSPQSPQCLLREGTVGFVKEWFSIDPQAKIPQTFFFKHYIQIKSN